ncbi:MAG: ferric reductase, partial [Pseudomonadota bacterium]
MREKARRPIRALVIWGALAVAVLVPLALSAASPLLQWRSPVYIAAGLAGVVALGLLLVQPVLMSMSVPGLSALQARHVHRWVGALLVAAVVVHVAGLWVASPPDVVDALLFRSPTP